MVPFVMVASMFFIRSGDSPTLPIAESNRVVYLGWTDKRLLEAMKAEWPDGSTDLVVNDRAVNFCRRAWPEATVKKFDLASVGDDGVTMELALMDLRKRASSLSQERQRSILLLHATRQVLRLGKTWPNFLKNLRG